MLINACYTSGHCPTLLPPLPCGAYGVWSGLRGATQTRCRDQQFSLLDSERTR